MMFLGNLVTLQRRIRCHPDSALGMVTASAFNSLQISPRNPNGRIISGSPYSASFQNLIHQSQETKPSTETQYSSIFSGGNSTIFLPSASQIYDFLVQRYQFSYGPDDAKQLHLQLIKYGLANDLFLSNILINLCVRTGDLATARNLFDEMILRNSVTWSCLISGYTQNEMPEEACSSFRRMIQAGLVPSHYAIGSVLRACQGLEARGLNLGTQIHCLITKTQHADDVVVCNVLVSMYGSCMGSADDCWRVFDEIRTKNSISWNAIISVYSQRGDAVSAFEIFSSMQQEGVGYSLRPTEYTFGSLITVASSSTNCGLFLLEQILARIEKCGFLQDLFVGSALVSAFARFGLLGTAKKIFYQMGLRNVVSMNGLMVGLVRQKRGEEAVHAFMEMKDLVTINSDSFVVLLSAFPEFCLLEEGIKKGREVHAYAIRTGLSNLKSAVGNGLINMYAKCGSVSNACSVFRLMVNKDLVSWNSMISSLDQNEHFRDAIMSFRMMKRDGLIPSNFTLISALSSCGSLGWVRMGKQVHGEGVKLGLDLDVSVSNALLALYAEIGCIDECKKVFSLMPEYDQVSWNSVIGAFTTYERSKSEAVGYFVEMLRAGWRLNTVTFINILGTISSLSLLEIVCQIHTLAIKYSLMSDGAVENALLSCYGKCGEMDDCEKIFSRMSERDDVSWNAMISGYIHNESFLKAMDLVWLMLHNGQRLDCFTFATVLSACASVATLERGMEVHACGIRAHLESDVVVGSALVDMYSKCGRIDYASRFFHLMTVKNVYSWNSMISGYARHGHADKALDLFAEMKLKGLSPDHCTFVGVLSACSHMGLVEQGFDHFESMTNPYGLSPRIEHYSCMVDLLGRAGEFDKIEDFINKMPMRPNFLIWRTVLGACGRANCRKTDLGRRAAETLLALEPQNAVNYVLLSNMYASGGKWEDVAKARTAMREAAAKKEAGCSWVTMKDGVHVFVAGDKSHPENDAIYEKLGELQRKMRAAGYVPQTRFALYDLELETKEELLSYHSEKLAVAFVLTRESELPIRIMKNLRICGDCHSAFRYISRIVTRQIILRDSIRFHHFVDGECSCKDYW